MLKMELVFVENVGNKNMAMVVMENVNCVGNMLVVIFVFVIGAFAVMRIPKTVKVILGLNVKFVNTAKFMKVKANGNVKVCVRKKLLKKFLKKFLNVPSVANIKQEQIIPHHFLIQEKMSVLIAMFKFLKKIEMLLEKIEIIKVEKWIVLFTYNDYY